MAGLLYGFRQPMQSAWFAWVRSWLHREAISTQQPDATTWQVLCHNLNQWRTFDAKRYRRASTPAEQQMILREARQTLEHSLVAMMRCWIGTPWAYEGTAETPGSGKIACGYFVSTILQGAGFRIERNALAQQASQNILRSFLPENELHVRIGLPYSSFCEEMHDRTPGVYLVGLDTHIGFLVLHEDDFRFLHASGSSPWCVVDESEPSAAVLERSKYRVYGHLSGNDEVIRRWLLGEKFSTKK